MGSASLKVNEPSMEEILASIRRIIADDQEAMDAPEPEEVVSSPLRNVLDLAERHASPILLSEPPAEPGRPERGIDSAGNLLQTDTFIPYLTGGYEAERPVPQPEAASRLSLKPAPAQVDQADASEHLLSGRAGASVSEAFGRLGAAVQPSQPQTVEELMKEMLRPMLKAWLDDNLPAVVERLVQGEIERIARRRG